MKKLLLVIVLMLVAVVFVSSFATSNVSSNPERNELTQIDFEDFGNSDIALPWGPVNP